MYTYGGFCFIESETRCYTLLITTFASFWVYMGIGDSKKLILPGLPGGHFMAKF